ncbi:MAG: sugar-binding protein [Winogradskyella sp.]|nr:MAG: sugar-binding protein [Winogradskyella sp.]
MNVYVDVKEKDKVETIKFNYKKEKQTKQLITVKQAESTPKIDGIADEAIWQDAQWFPINQLWIGKAFTKEDFQGKYKLTWTEDALYLLAEIQDDKLRDVYKDPLKSWWDEDCLEIFIDEDNSGGDHQYNHNAFAYHVDLEGNVVDVNYTKNGKLYNSHVTSARQTNGNTTIWEVKILLFNDTYVDDEINTPVKLSIDKKIGFALAYCDNDISEHRENFIGSIFVPGNDKDRGWKDASIFGTLLLTLGKN